MKLKGKPFSHPNDVSRIREMMLQLGYIVEDNDIHTAYSEYSDMFATGWLFIPDDGDFLKQLCESLLNNYFEYVEDYSAADGEGNSW